LRFAVRPAAVVLLLAYEGVLAAWIYVGFRHAGGGAAGAAAAAGVILLGVALGASGCSWWPLLAPIAAPLFAVPAGEYRHSELPVWYLAPLVVPALAFWIAVGVVARKLRRRRSGRRASTGIT
jgi:hypothetical protein